MHRIKRFRFLAISISLGCYPPFLTVHARNDGKFAIIVYIDLSPPTFFINGVANCERFVGTKKEGGGGE